MMVNGPLEIYALVIGAKLYADIFSILAACGLVFLPLLLIVTESVKLIIESPEGSNAARNRVIAQIAGYMAIIMLFVAPTWPLDVTGITYRPACSPHATASRFGDTGTTYDNVFEKLHYENIRLPIGLALVLSGASGITNAAMVSLPCKTDVSQIVNVINTAKLTPELTHEVGRFNSECYGPALNQFEHQRPKSARWKTIQQHYGGTTDLRWMGSHVLQTLYYDNLYPKAPVTGFAFHAYPGPYADYNAKHAKSPLPTPQWGYPRCATWWSEPNSGLKARLVELAKREQPNNPHLGAPDMVATVGHWLTEMKKHLTQGDKVEPDDVIARGLLYGVDGFSPNYTGWMQTSRYEDGVVGEMMTSHLPGVVALAGQGLGAVGSSIDRQEIAMEIPIIQAILLTFVLAFGPLILVLGRYQINVVFSYSFILFSIVFMTFIEHVVHYLEVSLHTSLSNGLYAMGHAPILYNLFTKLFLYAPMAFLMLMSMCGVAMGNAVSQAFNNSAVGYGTGLARGTGSRVIGGIKHTAKTTAKAAVVE